MNLKCYILIFLKIGITIEFSNHLIRLSNSFIDYIYKIIKYDSLNYTYIVYHPRIEKLLLAFEP